MDFEIRSDNKGADMTPITIQVVIERRVDLEALEALLNQAIDDDGVCEEVQCASRGISFICYRLWQLVESLKVKLEVNDEHE